MTSSRSATRLAGWYVISLRPLGQHDGVRRAAARAGARTFAVSTLTLQALDAGASLRLALAGSRVVVTSPAAARFAAAQQPLPRRRGQRWLAVGQGTARALQRAGVNGVETPTLSEDSPALLALPALRTIAGDTIGLITAPGGRGLLAASLRARGARVTVAEVYRRQPRALPPARLAALAALPKTSALLVSSGEAFTTLWTGLPEAARNRLRRRPAVASSPRLVGLLREHGFARVMCAGGARPALMVQALATRVAADGSGLLSTLDRS